MERNEKHGLCYLVTATKIERIPEKDRIVFMYNDKNNFKSTVSIDDAKVGEKFVFFEVDSKIPLCYEGEKEKLNPIFEFLKRSAQKNAKYAVIKARKMKDVVSMGLALPLEKSGLYDFLKDEIEKGNEDFTQILEVRKYEPPIACGGAQCLEFYNKLYHGKKEFTSLPISHYPGYLTDKSDEDNLYAVEDDVLSSYFDKECYATLKIDGTSTTIQVMYDEKGEGTYYIFGHNFLSDNTPMYKYFSENLDENGMNIFDRMVDHYRKTGENLLLCGEFYGPKIQGNPYDRDEFHFDVYKVVSYKDGNVYRHVVGLSEMKNLCKLMKADMVPIMYEGNLMSICNRMGYDGEKDAKKVSEFLYNIVEKLCYEGRDYRSFNLAEIGKYHEGIVITSMNGHSDSLKGKEDIGWSFKVKGLKYQAR